MALLVTVGACTTVSLGSGPGLLSESRNHFAMHMGSQVGVDVGGSPGVAVEGFIGPRMSFGQTTIGARTSYLLRLHEHQDQLAGLMETITGGYTLTQGVGLHAGVGLLMEGAIYDAANRRYDAGALRAMVGTTLWPYHSRTFGYGVTLELDMIQGWSDGPSYTSIGTTIGLELGAPNAGF